MTELDTTRMRSRQFALRTALISATVVAVAAARSFSDDPEVPVLAVGRSSLGLHFLWATFGITLLATAIGYRRYSPAPPQGTWLESALRLVTRFSFALTVAIGWAVLCFTVIAILHDPFTRVRFSALVATGITALYAGLIGFAAALMAIHTNPLRLLRLGLVVLFGGLALSIIATDNVLWATDAISFLGVGPTGIIFNLTFILSGLLLLALVVDKLSDLHALRDRQVFVSGRFNLYQALMVIACLCMGCIGIFPYSAETVALHNLSAHAALGLLVLLMLITNRVLPIYPLVFTWLSVGIAAACIIIGLGYFALGAISFSVMEVLLLAFGAVWILAFYAFTHQYINERDPALNDLF